MRSTEKGEEWQGFNAIVFLSFNTSLVANFGMLFFLVLFPLDFTFAQNSFGDSKNFDAKAISWFDQSYNEASDHFRELSSQLSNLGLSVQSKSYPLEGASQKFSVSSTFVKGSEKKIIVIVSGVHGAEAPAGSVIQRQLLVNLRKRLGQRQVGPSWLLIHGLNPYGFQSGRRVNENNVDLNRNFIFGKILESSQDPPKNFAYREIEYFLNPSRSLKYNIFSPLDFYLKAFWLAIVKGISAIRNATLQGQYSSENGIYYGGLKFESSSKVFKRILQDHTGNFENILFIDLHTGYGEKGKLHFFSDAASVAGVSQKTLNLFKGFDIDYGDDKNFYKVTGSIGHFVQKTFADKNVHTMTFEFGTQDSQNLLGSIFSLRTLIWENQSFHHGAISDSLIKVQDDFQSLFNPKSNIWRHKVLEQAFDSLEQLVPRFMSEINEASNN